MSKTEKMLKIDALLPKQRLSRNEMKAMDGGSWYTCYCDGQFIGSGSTFQWCYPACDGQLTLYAPR
ncbi:hypothetical protein [Labilibaculum euxinus]